MIKWEKNEDVQEEDLPNNFVKIPATPSMQLPREYNVQQQILYATSIALGFCRHWLQRAWTLQEIAAENTTPAGVCSTYISV